MHVTGKETQMPKGCHFLVNTVYKQNSTWNMQLRLSAEFERHLTIYSRCRPIGSHVALKPTPRSTQPSIPHPSAVGKSSTGLHGWG